MLPTRGREWAGWSALLEGAGSTHMLAAGKILIPLRGSYSASSLVDVQSLSISGKLLKLFPALQGA